MKRGRVFSFVLSAVGLAFAFLGQLYFAWRREYVWDGVLFWCVAILSIGLLLWRMDRPSTRQVLARRGVLSVFKRHSMRTLAVVGGVLLSLLAGHLARRRPELADFSDLLGLWLIGVAWFLLAFAPLFSLREVLSRTRCSIRKHRGRLVLLSALLVAALAVRTIDLEHIPANLGGDEGTWAMEGISMCSERLANPFATRWFAFPSMSFLVVGLSMTVFGQTIGGLRALSACIGTATVLTTFLMAREFWGQRVAWLAAILLAFGHFHLHYSRLAVNNIADGLLVTLSLWLLARGLRSRQDIYYALAGLVVGLGWYGYFGARLIGIVVVLHLVWHAVTHRRSVIRRGRSLVVLLGAALVVVAPLLLYYTDQPDALAARSRQVSIFASGWLAREQLVTGRSALSLLAQQLWKSVSAFNYTLDPTFWYRPAIPLLDWISGGLFVLGLLWTTAYGRRPANRLLLLWFWLAVLLGWVVTENPPSSMRLVVAAPALALLAGLGLNWVMELGQRLFVGGRRLWTAVAVVLLGAAAFLNLHYYFAAYTPTRVYGNPTAEVATELGRYLAQQNDDYVVHFYAPPIMYWDFGTLRFMARGHEGVDVPPVGEGQPVEPDSTRRVRFVFLPERVGELDEIRVRYPNGVERSMRSDADGRLLFVLYEVDRKATGWLPGGPTALPRINLL